MRSRFRIALRALYEFARYDLIHSTAGFARIYRQLQRQPVAAGSVRREASAICDGVSLAACFYFRPVPCLQRSVALTRMLRERGIAARLVIGYRPAPFFSHAWVEVEGRVVNDSPGYKMRLKVLTRV